MPAKRTKEYGISKNCSDLAQRGVPDRSALSKESKHNNIIIQQEGSAMQTSVVQPAAAD
jgi:hypothetical protein